MIMTGLMWIAILWAVAKIVGAFLLGVVLFVLSLVLIVWRMDRGC